MFDPNFVLLYVNNPPQSAAFYAELLGHSPVESQPNFALFVLSSGMKLGLWSKDTVEPAPAAHNGGSELCFTVESPERVRATHAAWAERGLAVIQSPTDMDFGHTFVALDPDGHRLRVFAPSAD
ncbi:MAG TPA: VOC family protein [Polyangiaceae bacterium]|jgi:catechol 2,3-dioxygenase-like lactoylglutathione lyase family enzyme|nr:VOC family protein [Polyangiaceae bacterium]